ncbi:hypothetical protein E3V36_01730 [Candidatus Marinimicrobia bacterium MT.SAG.2]|nr:hypothetical protein E3V36_01730 [Candidatus Marinimicrobia bacterium MT.SAG.2]
MNEFLVHLKPWIPFISLLTAVSAAVAAGAAWRSARITNKAIRAPIILKLLSEYASHEMLENLRLLSIWNDRSAGTDDLPTDELDRARRFVSHYFFKIYKLVDTNVVKEAFVRRLISSDQTDLYITVIESLEADLNPDYDQTPFDFFRDLHSPRWYQFFDK